MADRPTPELAQDKGVSDEEALGRSSGSALGNTKFTPATTQSDNVAQQARIARENEAQRTGGSRLIALAAEQNALTTEDRPSIEQNRERDFASARRRLDVAYTPVEERRFDGYISRQELAQAVQPIFTERGTPNPYLIQKPPTSLETQKFWLEKTNAELREFIATDHDVLFQQDSSWSQAPNWTELELLSLNTGIMPGNIDIINANAELWDEQQLYNIQFQNAFGSSIKRFENNKLWTDFQDVSVDILGADFYDALLIGLPLYLTDEDFTNLVAKMWREFDEGLLSPKNGEATQGSHGVQGAVDRFLFRYVGDGQRQYMWQQQQEQSRIIERSGAGIFQQWGFSKFVDGQDSDHQLVTRHPLTEIGPTSPWIEHDTSFLDRVSASFQPLDDIARNAGEELINKPWQWMFVSSDPSEPYRAHLTAGQNVATTLGQAPGSWGWQAASGTVDGAILVGLDPTNLLLGAGAIGKTLKAGVKAGKPTFRSVLQAAKPFAKQTTLNGYRVRGGPVGRMVFDVFGRTVDEMVESSDFIIRADEMRNMALAGANTEDFLTQFPEYNNVAGFMLSIAGDTTKTAAEVRKDIANVTRWTMNGELADRGAEIRAIAGGRHTKATEDLLDLVNEALENGTIGLGDVAGWRPYDSPFSGIMGVDMVVGLDANGVGQLRRTMQGLGDNVLAWRTNPKVLNLRSQKQMNDIRAINNSTQIPEVIEVRRYTQEEIFESVQVTRGRTEQVQITAFDQIPDPTTVTREGVEITPSTRQIADEAMDPIMGRGQQEMFGDQDTLFRQDSDFVDISRTTGQGPEIRGNADELLTEIPRSDVARDVDVLTSDRMTDVFVGYGEPQLVKEHLIKSLEHKTGRLKIKGRDGISVSEQRLDDIRAMADRMGYDAIKDGDTVVITNRGRKKLVSATDTMGTKLEELFGPQLEEWLRTKRAEQMTHNLQSEQWWVDPSLPGSGAGFTRFSRGIERTLDKAPDWASNPLRRAWAWASNPLPSVADFTDKASTIQTLRSMTIHGGLGEDFLDQWVRRIDQAPFEEMRQVWDEMLEDLASRTDDLPTKLNLWSFVGKDQQRKYLTTHGARPLNLGVSSSRGDNVISAQPHRPELISRYGPVPNVHHYRRMGRLRSAQRTAGTVSQLTDGTVTTKRGFAAGIRDKHVRGWLPSTNNRRTELARNFKARAIERGVDKNLVDELSDQDWYNIAYATLLEEDGIKHGLGIVSQVARATSNSWNEVRQTFNIFQLALNPVRWFLKVVGVEEQTRGYLAAMPNLYGNPVRRISAGLNQRALQHIEEWDAGVKASKGLATTAIVDPLIALKELGKGKSMILRELKNLWPEAPISKFRKLDAGDIPSAVRREINAMFDKGTIEQFGSILGQETVSAFANLTKNQKRLMSQYGFGATAWDQNFFDDLGGAAMRDIFGSASDDAILASNGIVPHTASTVDRTSKTYIAAMQDELTSSFATLAMDMRIAALTQQYPDLRKLHRMIRSSDWAKMRDSIASMARFEFKGNPSEVTRLVNNDLALGQWYFGEHYKRILDHFLDSHYGDDVAKEVEVLRRAKNDKVVDLGRFGEIDLAINGQGDRAYARWFKANDGMPGFNEVKDFEPTFNPMRIMGEKQSDFIVWRGLRQMRKPLRWVTQKMGTEASLTVTRKPMMAAATQDYLKLYTDLGYDPVIAAKKAQGQAAETINMLMYNMDNSTEMIEKFNKIVPFGAAMVEVSKVWLWDLPVKHLGGAGLGHMALAHRIDRMEQALVSMGIAEFQWVNEDDHSRGQIMKIVGDRESPSAISRGLHAMMGFTGTLGNALGNVRTAAYGQNAKLEGDSTGLSDLQRGESSRYEWTYGKSLAPFRLFDGDNYGLFALSNFSIGTVPFVNLGINKLTGSKWVKDIAVLDAIFSENDKIIVNEGDSLGSLASAHGITVDTILSSQANVDKIMKYDDLYLEMVRRRNEGLDIANMALPEGITFDIPNTNNAHLWYEQIFNPFGRSDSFTEAAKNMVPSPIQQAMKGLGIHEGVFEEESTAAKAGSVLSTVLGPMSMYENDPGIARGLRFALSQPVTNGEHTGMTRFDYMWMRTREVSDIENKLVAEGKAEWSPEGEFIALADENGSLPNLGELEGWRRREQLLEELDAMTDATIERAVHLYGQQQFTKAIGGFLMPTGVRAFTYEEQEIGAFWAGKEIVDQYKELDAHGAKDTLDQALKKGDANLSNISLDVVLDWFYDETSETTTDLKRALAERYPHLRTYTQSTRIYNGPLYAQAPSLQEYFDQIAAGDIQHVKPEVFLMRVYHTALTDEQLTERRALFGTNEDGSLMSERQMANNALLNWDDYSDHLDKFNGRREALRYYDTEYFDGAYENLRKENGDLWDPKTEEEDAQQQQLDMNLRTVNRELSEVADALAETEMLWDIDPERAEQMQAALFQERTRLKRIKEGLSTLKGENNFGSEFDDALSEFFDLSTNYFDRRGALYEEVNSLKDDPLGKSLIYDNIRVLENQEYSNVYRGAGGVAMPNAVQWGMGFMSEEQKERRVWKVIGKKTEWLSARDVDELLEYSSDPEKAATFLPVTPEDWNIYYWRNDELNRVKEWERNGFDADGETYTPRQADKEKKKIKELFAEHLKDYGRQAEYEFVEDYTPWQRMQGLGVVPEGVEPLIALSEHYKESVLSTYGPDKSLASNDAKLLFRQVYWPEMQNFLNANPEVRQEIETLGQLLIDTPEARGALWYLTTGNLGTFGGG